MFTTHAKKKKPRSDLRVEPIPEPRVDPADVVQKRCITCKYQRPRSDFYGNYHGSDSLRGECKPCTRSRARTHYRQVKGLNAPVGLFHDVSIATRALARSQIRLDLALEIRNSKMHEKHPTKDPFKVQIEYDRLFDSLA